MILNFPENTAIIGNGPKEIGKGSGKIIDSFEFVARMNNFDISNKFIPDYGQKVDFWVTSFNKDIWPREENISRIFCPFDYEHPNWSWKYKAHKPLLERYAEITEFIPPDIFAELFVLHQHPSTGIAFLYWIFKSQGERLDTSNIFGFSHFSPEDIHQYWHHKGENSPGTDHDFDKTERQLFLGMTL